MIKKLAKDHYKQAIFVLILVAVSFWLSQLVVDNDSVQNIVSMYGYIGIFLISAISGFNLVVPIPVATFLPVFLASGLEFWYVIFVISFGMTMGDTMGYLVGRAGKAVVSVHMKDMMKRLQRWKKNNPKKPLVFLVFYSMLAPFPNELVVVPLAFLGYKLKNIFPIVLIGNFIFNTLLAKGIITVFNSL